MADLKQLEQLVNFNIKEVNEISNNIEGQVPGEPAAATVVVSGAGDSAA
jgi:hypothetical protein